MASATQGKLVVVPEWRPRPDRDPHAGVVRHGVAKGGECGGGEHRHRAADAPGLFGRLSCLFKLFFTLLRNFGVLFPSAAVPWAVSVVTSLLTRLPGINSPPLI